MFASTARHIFLRPAAGLLRSHSALIHQLDFDLLLHKSPQTSNDVRQFHSSSAVHASKSHSKQKRAKKSKCDAPRSKGSQKPPPNSKRERKFNKMLKKQEEANPKQTPPAYLTRTASPNVYIARSAIMNEDGSELFVDPTTLFSEYTPSKNNSPGGRQRKSLIPHIFRQSHLQYFSPAVFPNHEPPTDGTPEVCFLGRSNTGKSSLINALHSTILKSGGGGGSNKNVIASGGGELARTSKTPGRTQTINYFGLVPNNAKSANDDPPKAKLFLVDLPGFGYASAPDESVDVWQKRTQQFLISRMLVPEERGDTIQPWPSVTKGKSLGNTRSIQHDASLPPLKRLYLLIDSRLPEPQYLDLSVMGWCDDYSIPYTLVLTKVDGSSRAHCVKLTNQLCMRYHSLLLDQAFSEEDGEVCMDPVVYWTSSKDGLGMEELLSSVEGCVLDSGNDDGSGMHGLDDTETSSIDESGLDELEEPTDESDYDSEEEDDNTNSKW